MSHEVLRVCGLKAVSGSNGRRQQIIVNNVSLVLHQSEMLGLIGESGAGKSTIGLAALGFARRGCRFVGGSVMLGNINVLNLSPGELREVRGRRIAYIPQSAAAAFNPTYKIIEQVAEGPTRHRLLSRIAARHRAIELFASLGLPNPETFGLRYPHQVSGGQLQRAAMAMAMSCRPDVLVLDEPTTALDVSTQVGVLASVKRMIQEEGTAGLYISHDLAVVAQMASRIVVLRDGNVVESGLTEEILSHPKVGYTRRLVSVRQAVPRPPRAATPPLLSVDQVKARYGSGDLVLASVSLTVQRGETVALVGESGSGKSSLARVVSGLMVPEEGVLSIYGHAWPSHYADRSKDQRRRIQLVFQSPDTALNPNQTILDIVGRPISLYFNRSSAQIRRRVAELLDQVDLAPEFVSRRPTELSGGQKQRVAIARALAAEPELIICDEITSALDSLVADEVLNLLNRLQIETGIAYLFITHDINTVRRIADRVVVMQKGEVVAEGPQSHVFRAPLHPYTQQLLEAVPELRRGWLDDKLTTVGNAV